MLTQSDLRNLAAAFDEPGLHGLLLHGSCARQTDDDASDIDLIGIKRTGPAERKRAIFTGRNVELYFSPPGKIRRAFARVQGSNNNVLLNAFVRGHILADHSGVVARLVRAAKNVWQEGPPAISAAQRARRADVLIHGLERCKRAAWRASSELSRELAKILCDRVFREAVSLYCRINRRWASSLAETVEWFQRDDPQVYELCRQYLLSTSLDQRVAALGHIIAAVAPSETRFLRTQ